MSLKVSVDQLSRAIVSELENYSNDICSEIKTAAKKTGKECANEIKKKAPGNEYPKYWRSKAIYENKYGIIVACYNSKKPGLAHLLEYGHVISNGTRRSFGNTGSFPHVKPAEINAIQKFEKMVMEILGK